MTPAQLLAMFARPAAADTTLRRISSSPTGPASGSPIVISNPGALQNDLLIALLGQGVSGSWGALPSGWTQDRVATAKPPIQVAHLIAGASEPSSYSFAGNGGTSKMAGDVLLYRNAAFDVISTVSTLTGSGTLGSNLITVSSSGSIVLCFVLSSDATATFTAPSGYSAVDTLRNGSVAPSMAVFERTNAPTGSTFLATGVTQGSTAVAACVILSIKHS